MEGFVLLPDHLPMHVRTYAGAGIFPWVISCFLGFYCFFKRPCHIVLQDDPPALGPFLLKRLG